MFTRQELDTLFEAVEKWEQDDFADEMAGAMIEGMAKASGADLETISKIKTTREDRKKTRKRLNGRMTAPWITPAAEASLVATRRKRARVRPGRLLPLVDFR